MGTTKQAPAPHTPTPWRIVDDSELTIADAHGGSAIAYLNMDPNEKVRYADAAFIVRAVNAHDDLLAACKDALRKLDLVVMNAMITPSMLGNGSRAIGSYIATVDALRAAIAKAEGK